MLNNNSKIKLIMIALSLSLTGCITQSVIPNDTAVNPLPINVTVNVVMETPIDQRYTPPPVPNPPVEEPVRVVTKTIKVPQELCRSLQTLYKQEIFSYTPGDALDIEENMRFAKSAMAWINNVNNLLVEARSDGNCSR